MTDRPKITPFIANLDRLALDLLCPPNYLKRSFGGVTVFVNDSTAYTVAVWPLATRVLEILDAVEERI
jgi:hypothetical protein